MFLATTALTDFWDTKERIVFLGSWCTRCDRRSQWATFEYEVMPSPWDDRERFYTAAEYLDECGERLLGQLASYLNAVHGVSHSLRYWRIVIGPWLLSYLHAVYDRYVHLNEAFRRYGDLDTIVLDPASYRTPTDGVEASAWICDDPYNLQVISQVLADTGASYRSRDAGAGGWLTPRARRRRLGTAARDVLRWSARLAEAAGRISRTWQNQVVLCDMAAPRRDLWRLAARTRLRAVPMKVEWPSASVAAKPVFDRRRDGLAGLSGQDDFQRTWIKTLSHNFPTLYLEGYEKARAMTLQRHGRLPSAIVSETGWYSSEPFKFLAAEASELGVCLLAAQHGGSYGIRRAIPPERHEADSSDAYVVWGWGAVGDGRYLNWPAPRPSALRIARRRAARRRVGTSLLFVATADPRYLHYFHSRPTGSQWESYFEWQHRFLAALPAAVRSRVRFRANAGDFGQMVWPRIRERYPEIRPGSDGRFRGWMERSRLIVFDHCGTGMLEALNANVPTVAFWDPERWEVRAGAEADCHRLREVGILHDSPENAAAHVTVLFDAPERWWGEEIVQTARLAFARRYGFETEDWVGYWARELTGFCYGHRNRK